MCAAAGGMALRSGRIEIDAEDAAGPGFAPGQFNMLTVFGVGEVAISLSGDPAEPGRLVHTIRAVGPVSAALAQLSPGDVVGVARAIRRRLADGSGGRLRRRHPGRRARPRAAAPGALSATRQRSRYGQIVLLYGTRSPDEILFRRELEAWRRRLDIDIEVDG